MKLLQNFQVRNALNLWIYKIDIHDMLKALFKKILGIFMYTIHTKFTI